MEKRHKKPLNDRLAYPIQVLLKEHEMKIFDRIRRELNFPTNAAFARIIILREIEKKKQTELL